MPAISMGLDIGRSKSMDRDSSNAGDWFNRIDFSYQSNNWAVGLPHEIKNSSSWLGIIDVLQNADISLDEQGIMSLKSTFNEFLQIRNSSLLFSLPSLADIQTRLRFHNQDNSPVGVIVMEIGDLDCGAHVDPSAENIVVVFNPRLEQVSFPMTGAEGYSLHPTQVSSADPITRSAGFSGGTFITPPQTTSVFVKERVGSCIN
jgi:pullulanase